MSSPAAESNRFYLAAWRWHFYAGLFVVPFLLMLAATGLVMLLSRPLDEWRHRDRLRVTPAGAAISPEAQVHRVRAAYPEGTVATYLPPRAPDRSALLSLVLRRGGAHHAGQVAADTLAVYVDPYTGRVLGAEDPLRTPYAWASRVHGTLLLGTAGDRAIEVAAGFGVLLIATGLFLWWPRGGQRAVLWPRVRGRRRVGWRDVHAALGFWGSGALAFFLLSGLAWTGVWGGRLVQGFGSLPPAQMQSPSAPAADATHATHAAGDAHAAHGTHAPARDPARGAARAPTHESLNGGARKEVPWALEQTPMPASGSRAGRPGIPAGTPVGLDAVVAFARADGFTGYRVHFPRDAAGVWTVAAATMSGDVTDPRRDRVLHLDQYTGRVLADYRFPDYPPLGKAMAAGIALHQGNAGVVNLAANVLFCLGVVALSASGAAIWWMRRPAGVRRLVPPPMPRDVRAWRAAAAVMFALSLAFPLVALTLAAVALLDLAVVSRVPALRRAVK